jgi:hypothetical protein
MCEGQEWLCGQRVDIGSSLEGVMQGGVRTTLLPFEMPSNRRKAFSSQAGN